MSAAATLFTVLAIALIVFHLAAAVGAPLGHLTQGGRCKGALDRRGRLMAVASAALVALMIFAVRAAAGLPPGWPRWTFWASLALLVITAAANAATPSAAERRLGLPWALALLLTALAAGFG